MEGPKSAATRVTDDGGNVASGVCRLPAHRGHEMSYDVVRSGRGIAGPMDFIGDLPGGKMEKQLEAYMRMGIVHFMAFPGLTGGDGPWIESVRHIARDPFFTAIELTHIEDDAVRDEVKELIQLARLSVGYGAHPAILSQGLNINDLREQERVRACAALREHIDEAIYMGAENFVILSGKDPGKERREDALDALIQSLNDLCSYSAANDGPKIVIEAFDCEVDKCCLLGPASLGQKVAQAICKKHENFGLLVDLSHIPLLKETPEEALTPVKEYLAGVHIGNAVIDPNLAGYGDNHPAFGTPGSANDVGEVTCFLQSLLDLGFLNGRTRPMVSFEIKPFKGQDPLVVISNAQRVMKEAWARV